MLDADTIATSLFDKIRSRFEKVSVGDENAKETQEPAKCRFFNFDFTDDNGNKFGNVTITLVDERSLKIYFGKNLSADLDEEQKKSWYDFLRDLRMFAKRNLLSFDARDISRSNLNIKDLKQMSSTMKPDTVNSSQVAESKNYANTKKVKYETVDNNTRLRIVYSDSIDETIGKAKSQKIHGIYVEDGEGQRFKVLPHLGHARAQGRHIANGGQINDDFGRHITELATEQADLKKFCRVSRNKTFENDEAMELVSSAKDRYHQIRHILNRLQNKRGYMFYKDQYKPSKTLQDDIDLEELRKKFVTTNFDERLESGLAHAAKAHKMRSTVDQHVDEFAESLESITEGSWALPDNDLAVQHLQELMAKVLEAGIDGANATGALYDIIGDDDLFDRIYDASKGSPEMDVRPVVMTWLESNMPSVAAKIRVSLEQDDEEPEEQDAEEPPAPEVEPQEPPPEQPAPGVQPEQQGQDIPAPGVQQEKPAPGMESHTKSGNLIAEIRKLAGLAK